MSNGGGSRIAETGTPSSRVIFLNSNDAQTIFNNETSNFMFTFEEPIVVPNHHSILLSLIGAEIPYSFYSFINGRNTRFDFVITAYGTQPAYIGGFMNPAQVGTLTPSGNWNAIELAQFITDTINTSAGAICFSMVYDSIALKFKMIALLPNFRITLAMRNGTASGPNGDDMNEELGWDLENIIGDPYCEQNPAGPNIYGFGYTNPPPGGTGFGVDSSVSGPFVLPTYLYADDVADLTNSIRSLFIRSNLSTSSIMDSFIGGGFSNLLARIPINADSGGIINLKAADGDIHKLLLKVKEFTSIHIRLTNQRNETLQLNGLNFDIALKLDFIENQRLSEPEHIRELVKISEKEEELLEDIKTKKKKTKKSK